MTDWEDVDRVLAGLRAAEPGVGMEARVLLALEQQPLQNLRPGAQRGLHVREFWSWTSRERITMVGALAAVLLVMSPVVLHVMRRGATPRAGGVAVTNRLESTALPRALESRAVAPGAVEPRASSRTNQQVAGGSGERSGVSESRSAMVSARNGVPAAVAEATVSNARIESFPAPPMPLTRQERLLLRMLEGGQSAELVAALSAGAEQAMEAHDGAHRIEFFSPPRPVQELKNDEAERPGVDAVGHMGPVVATPADTKETHAK